MQRDGGLDYARAAALSVNLAVDSVEVDIRKELEIASGETAEALSRLLAQLDKKRIDAEKFNLVGSTH